MNLGIDISSIIYGTGVSAYTKNLVQALSKLDRVKLTLFGTSFRRHQTLQEFAFSINGARPAINWYPPTLQSVLFNRLNLPIETFTKAIDVFHAWDWFVPTTRQAALVSTVHDLTAIKFKRETDPSITKHHQQSLHRLKTTKAHVIADSNATKQDLISMLGFKADHIQVVYPALPKEKRLTITTDQVEQVKRKFQITKPYLLIVSPNTKRKNLKRMVDVWASFQDEYQLVITGNYIRDEIVDHPGLITTGFLTDHELSALYHDATCLLYTSLYEGFGFPILEAYFHQTPVVTSDVSSLPEVAGDAAVLVDPTDSQSIKQGIDQALNLRDSLVQKGTQQLQQFSWKSTAEATHKVYQKALNPNHGN